MGTHDVFPNVGESVRRGIRALVAQKSSAVVEVLNDDGHRGIGAHLLR